MFKINLICFIHRKSWTHFFVVQQKNNTENVGVVVHIRSLTIFYDNLTA